MNFLDAGTGAGADHFTGADCGWVIRKPFYDRVMAARDIDDTIVPNAGSCNTGSAADVYTLAPTDLQDALAVIKEGAEAAKAACEAEVPDCATMDQIAPAFRPNGRLSDETTYISAPQYIYQALPGEKDENGDRDPELKETRLSDGQVWFWGRFVEAPACELDDDTDC